MLPYSMIAGGTFTNTVSTAQDLVCISQNPPDYVVMRNLGSSASTGWGEASDAQEIEWFWHRAMAQGTAKGISQSSDASNPAMIATFLSSDGISTYDTASPPTYTTNTSVTAVTKGSASGVTVVTLTNDGNSARGPKIAIGDFVRLTNIAGMQQISGAVFQVVNTTSTTSITVDLDSSGFAASGTTGSCTKVIPSRYYPRAQRIIAITQANPCVVSVIRDTDFTVGEEVSFRIPSNAVGYTTMTQLNNVKGVVTAVTAATTTTCSLVTVNVDTSGMTAFALPTSAQAAAGIGQQPIPLLVPAGSGVIPNQNPPGTNLVDAFDNRNTRIIHCGGSMFANGTTGDIWEWQAFKYDEYNNA